MGKRPLECSGAPGDFRTPNATLESGAATHGPNTPGQPVELRAIARPSAALGAVIPLLYIYGPEGEYVSGAHAYEKLLASPTFAQVEKESYWGSIEGNHYYQIPWLDKCSQAAMLSEQISFRAPQNGIMFMQFLAQSCTECKQLTRAIEAFIVQNPQMLVRWIRVSVPSSVGTLSK